MAKPKAGSHLVGPSASSTSSSSQDQPNGPGSYLVGKATTKSIRSETRSFSLSAKTPPLLPPAPSGVGTEASISERAEASTRSIREKIVPKLPPRPPLPVVPKYGATKKPVPTTPSPKISKPSDAVRKSVVESKPPLDVGKWKRQPPKSLPKMETSDRSASTPSDRSARYATVKTRKAAPATPSPVVVAKTTPGPPRPTEDDAANASGLTGSSGSNVYFQSTQSSSPASSSKNIPSLVVDPANLPRSHKSPSSESRRIEETKRAAETRRRTRAALWKATLAASGALVLVSILITVLWLSLSNSTPSGDRTAMSTTSEGP